MKVKNKKKVVDAIDECLIFINKRLDKKEETDDKKKDKKVNPLLKSA